ncbi:MAG: hypothetical protein LBP40_03860 [Campylobacteraceae bacterium]|nr:hypothetical protein [Campylobacteraceae bacterium]
MISNTNVVNSVEGIGTLLDVIIKQDKNIIFSSTAAIYSEVKWAFALKSKTKLAIECYKHAKFVVRHECSIVWVF